MKEKEAQNQAGTLSGIRRRQMIRDELREKRDVQVAPLAAALGVSEMTIRRDLHFLEEQGICTLHYGGASLREGGGEIEEFDARKDRFAAEKRRIAARAAEFIREGQTVFLDMSTTVLLILSFLPEVKFTAVTNSIPAAREIIRHPGITLKIAPGVYREQYGGTLDYTTVEYVSRFHYDLAFFGTIAVDAAFGASAVDELEAAVKQAVERNADASYLLTDRRKVGAVSNVRFGEVRDYAGILTDRDLDMDEQQKLIRAGAHLFLC